MQSWLFWNALSNQDGLELTGICLFPEPRARPRACKFRVNLVTHTRHTRDSTLEGDGKKDRKDKKKSVLNGKGNGLVAYDTDLLSPTTPLPPLSYEVTYCPQQHLHLRWAMRWPGSCSLLVRTEAKSRLHLFVFCADYLKKGDFEGHICVHSCCWGPVCPSQQQRSLGGLGTFLLTSPPLSLTTPEYLPASLCPQTFWLWLFLWRKSNNTIWCPSPDSEPLNTSYSFVGCSPGCLPSMAEGKSKMIYLAF